MSTRLRGVTCSYETFKCYHLLQLFVANDEGAMVFQPTVVENELFRFLRALTVLPKARVQSSATMENAEADLLGQYLNGQVLLSSGRAMEVMAYFGKQSAVKQQLTADGWWPRNLSDHIRNEEEGVYGLIQGNMDEDGGDVRVVLFGWLTYESFEGALLRERATYVLRFLTTLTSNVVCCLAPPDVIRTKRPAPDSEAMTSSKKYSVSFSIQTAKVQEEQVRCEYKYEAGWGDAFDGGVLVPGPVVALAVVKSDRHVVMNRSNHYLNSAESFGKWLIEVMKTHAVDVQCQIPRPMMASALKLKDEFPKEVLDSITEDAISEQMLTEAKKKVKLDLANMQKRCEENGANVFYVRNEGPEQEMMANDALQKDLKMLKGWHMSVGSALQPKLSDFRSTIDNTINNAYAPIERSHASQMTGLLGYLMRLSKSTTRVLFPYLAKDELVKQALDNSTNLLRTYYQNWCRLLNTAMKNENMIAWRVNYEHAAMMKGANLKNVLASRKEEVVRNCFAAMMDNHNKGLPVDQLVTEVISVYGHSVNFTKQEVKDNAEIVSIYSTTKASNPELRGRVTLPKKAKVLHISLVEDVCLLVYLQERVATMETQVRAYKKSSWTKPVVTKNFPKETSLCDFDPSHRLLAMLHSVNVVDLYAFNESYKVLERVQSVNLQILRVQSPFSRMVIFGGDNHGLAVIDHEGRLQSSFIRSKQVSKLVEHLVIIGNTKVVKVQGGAMLMLLTMDDMHESSYTVKVQTILTADNTMLPEAALKIPVVMEWSRCSVSCVGETLVCFDPESTRVRMWTLHIATGKMAWQLQGSQTTKGESNVLEAHPMWSLFHLFEKFPVQSLVAKSIDNALVSGRLQLHVSGMANKAVMTDLLTFVMHKLQGLNKNLSPLNLEDDLQVHTSGSVSWCGSTVSMAPWVLELVGFVPVQICRARDNQLVLLKNGQEESSFGTEAHEVAKSIWFGPISGVLQHWSGPVVVLTSMGKQSTGKSYYLNHLTGSSFAISGARCTDGVWLTVRLMGNCLLVVLDFEGLGSFERSAQEDTFLSVLNAAVSRLTVFRIEMRFDKDIDTMFSKFQQGVSLLKGDPRLFQGKLYLNAKDVNPNDQNTVIHEFQTKLEAILNENRADNFVTAMYGGNVEITCCPPLGNVGYYEALGEGLELLEKSRDMVPYANGLDFYDCLTMERLAIELRSQIRTALRYGKLAHCGLVDGEPEEYVEKWKTLFADTDIVQSLPEDASMDFELDLNLKTEKLLQESKIILMKFFKTYLEYVDEPRSPSIEAQFDNLWTFLLWRREHRVRLWVSSLPSVGREEMDDLDACVLKLKQHLRRCQHTCAHCKLGCFECFLHDATVPHDCGTNHKCVNPCVHCASLGDKEMCASVAGHSGPCNCGLKDHTCNEPCDMMEASNCEKTCSLEVGHEEPHSCGVKLHCCGQPCQAVECRGSCTLPFENPHDRHMCGANRCQQTCVMPDCGNTCAAPDHFHPVGANHLCGQPHRCTAECKEDGICEIKVHLEKITETFAGKRGTFDFTRQEMNGTKRKCSEAVAADTTSHPDDHRCNSAIHYCDVRCPCCQYFCDKAYGHADLHRTSHGNMKDTYFVSDSQAVDIGDRKYTAGEQGVAEMCPFFCSKMGRGHVHFMPCKHKANTCVYTTSDGRKHCNLKLEPNPTMPMDEVLHETYWKTLGWEDPVTSAVEKASFKLCPFKCDASDHSEDSPSYCILDAWHDIVDKTDPRGQQANHSVVQGHLFACKHYAARGKTHHIFVLDASGSMSGPPWAALTDAVHGYLQEQVNKKGVDCGDLVSVVTFSSSGLIVFEAQPIASKINTQIPFQGAGTDFDTGLRCAIEVLSRNRHDMFSPVLLFFSDGYSNTTGSGEFLADHIVANFERFNLSSYLVGFGNMNYVCLEKLATRLHGSFHNAVSGIDLLETFKSISVSVHLRSGLVAKTAAT
ncbi:hypothetical protein AC1031_002095 [Aphanomyces cochlioides]|nr:hypothetical protein AC1031_002095 [Aphanomyces cochlioides]